MDYVKLDLSVDPVAKGRPRISRQGHAFTPHKTRAFEREIQLLMRSKYSGAAIDYPISVSVVFHLKKPKSVKRPHPSVKPDLDNLTKAILDAGNGILWSDDALICELNIEKKYSDSGAIEIQIWPIKHGAAEDSTD